MLQEVLALAAVFGALTYLFWNLFRIVVPSKNKPKSYCSSCPASAKGGCSAKIIN